MSDRIELVWAIIFAMMFLGTLILCAFGILPIQAYYYIMTFAGGAVFYKEIISKSK